MKARARLFWGLISIVFARSAWAQLDGYCYTFNRDSGHPAKMVCSGDCGYYMHRSQLLDWLFDPDDVRQALNVVSFHWTSLPCGGVPAVYESSVEDDGDIDTEVYYKPGSHIHSVRNIAHWVDPAGNQVPVNFLAFTFRHYDGSYATEFKMKYNSLIGLRTSRFSLNGVDDWTDGQRSVPLEDVLVHEVGHVYGLDHPSDLACQDQIMAVPYHGVAAPGRYDKAGICALYLSLPRITRMTSWQVWAARRRHSAVRGAAPSGCLGAAVRSLEGKEESPGRLLPVITAPGPTVGSYAARS